jgi:hypothetical protein
MLRVSDITMFCYVMSVKSHHFKSLRSFSVSMPNITICQKSDGCECQILHRFECQISQCQEF